MKRRFCSVILCMLTLLWLGGTVEAAYMDIHGHWAEAAVQTWTDYGVLKGDGGKFRPDAPMMRCELAALLSNALGLPEVGTENPFTDVPPDAWYTPALLRCHEAGLIDGYQGQARPTEHVNRQEAAVMLARALAIPEANQNALGRYTDAGQIADWAAGYVAALTERGVVSGVGGGRFDPTASVTRASVAAMLDHAVIQYIHTPGRYSLQEGKGIILVAAGGVNLTGESGADLLLTSAADGGAVTFDHARLSGAVTVQANRATVLLNDSSLTPPLLVGMDTEIRSTGGQTPTPTKTAQPTPSGGNSHSSSSGSGNQGGSGGTSGPDDSGSSQTPQDLVISDSRTLVQGNYRNVRITSAVGNGTVILKDLTISGDVTIQGGGSHSVRLTNCTVLGKIIMDKASGAQAELPRLALTNTPVRTVEVRQLAILESDGTIDAVLAKDHVTVAAGTVGKIEIPAEADGKQVQIHVPSTASVEEIVVNARLGAQITGDGSIGGVRAGSEDILHQIEVPSGVTVSTHDHIWDGGSVATAPTCTASGTRIFQCTLSGCAATKSESIPALSHRWGDVQRHDSLEHKRNCADCGAEASEPHSFGSAIQAQNRHKVVCSICGEEKSEPHTGGNGSPVTGGLEHSLTCTACGATCSEAHKFGAPVEDGNGHKTVCSVCGEEKSEPHTGDDGSPVTGGLEHSLTCTICGATWSEAHKFGAPIEDGNGHKTVCSVCGEEKSEPHTGGNGSPVTGGLEHSLTCAACGATWTEAHKFGAPIEDGNGHKTVCSVCGEEKRQLHIPGQATAVEGGVEHSVTCTVCDAVWTEAHRWDEGNVLKAPSLTETGVMRYTCTICKTTREEMIPILQEKFSTVTTVGMVDDTLNATSNQPITFTLTLPDDVQLISGNPTVTCSDASVSIANTLVESGVVHFDATPSGLSGELKIRFYLGAGDTDLPYPLTSQEICLKAGRTLTATGTVTPSRFQLIFSEPVAFYTADGNEISESQLAAAFSVYQDGQEKPMCTSYRLGSFDGKTITCYSCVFNYAYTEASYRLHIEKGIYACSKTSSKLRLEGDLPLAYEGPQALYDNAVYNQSKQTLSFSIESIDGYSDLNPSFDFTKLLVVQAPGGSYENAIVQNPLGSYVLSESSPHQRGTFTMSYIPLDQTNPLAPTPASWDVTVYLREEDVALFQAISSGECLLAVDPGFCTGAAGKRVFFHRVVFK